MCGPLPPQSKCHAPFWNVVLIPFGGYIISSSAITCVYCTMCTWPNTVCGRRKPLRLRIAAAFNKNGRARSCGGLMCTIVRREDKQNWGGGEFQQGWVGSEGRPPKPFFVFFLFFFQAFALQSIAEYCDTSSNVGAQQNGLKAFGIEKVGLLGS